MYGPISYQLWHWWHWLTYGEGFPNAVAVQAVGTGIAAVAAIAAAWFAYNAYATAQDQLKASLMPFVHLLRTYKKSEDESLPLKYKVWALENRGPGPAMNVQFYFPDSSGTIIRCNVTGIGPGGKYILGKSEQLKEACNFLDGFGSRIIFQSAFGDWYEVQASPGASLHDDGEVEFIRHGKKKPILENIHPMALRPKK